MPVVCGHHEQVDGRGSPEGPGAEVSLQTGLISVADVWDAMSHARQFRQGMSLDRVTAIPREGAGTQWRPDAVELLLAEVEANGPVEIRHLAEVGERVADVPNEADCVCEDAVGADLGIREVVA